METEIKDNIYALLSDTSGSFVFGEGDRKEYKKLYGKTSIPTKQQEDWKYIDLKKVFENSYLPSIEISCHDDIAACIRTNVLYSNRIVFVNGVYSDAFSVVEGHVFGVEKINNVSRKMLNATGINEDNKLTLLNSVFVQNGIAITIPENTVSDEPLEIFYINSSSQALIGQTRNLIVAEKNSSAKFIEHHLTIGLSNVLNNIATEVICSENARVEINSVSNVSNSDTSINSIKVKQLANSTFTYNSVLVNGGTLRSSIVVNQDDEFCTTNLNGLFVSKSEQYFDNYTLVNHNKPNCTTNENYKGIANDKSTGVFVGKIFVAPDAQKTMANQSNKNIILSDWASIYSKPQLEIFADDVSCSHGSTTGQINKEALFYMQQRGIPRNKAVLLLLNAFFSDVTNLFSDEKFKGHVDFLIENNL